MKRLLCLVAVASALGCGPKLNIEKTIDIDMSENKQTILEPIRNAQKVKIHVHADGGPIDVSVYLEKNKAAAEKEIYAKGGANLLADKRDIQEETFDVTIPAAEAAVIDLKAATVKKAKVTLKVTN